MGLKALDPISVFAFDLFQGLYFPSHLIHSDYLKFHGTVVFYFISTTHE